MAISCLFRMAADFSFVVFTVFVAVTVYVNGESIQFCVSLLRASSDKEEQRENEARRHGDNICRNRVDTL